jgi:Helix-turn-helix domain
MSEALASERSLFVRALQVLPWWSLQIGRPTIDQHGTVRKLDNSERYPVLKDAALLSKLTTMTSNDVKRRAEQGRIVGEASPESVAILSNYFTIEELAGELNVAPITVKRWNLQKSGPPITRVGRRILYRRSSVEAWLVAQEQK